jgi:Mn2+/Fe2+ NRAMP family transporter
VLDASVVGGESVVDAPEDGLGSPVFYSLVALGTLGGTILTLTHVDPVQLLVISAYINGVAAAPSLLLIMLISNNSQIMGEHRNGRIAACLGWITFALMSTAAITSFTVGG